MNQEANLVIKKILQKIANHVVNSKNYSDFNRVDIFFAFGSKHKTAMCDWVYGMKIYTKIPYGKKDEKVRELQMDIRKITDNHFKQSVCCTDVIFEGI
jgi:hypothetical protein